MYGYAHSYFVGAELRKEYLQNTAHALNGVSQTYFRTATDFNRTVLQ
jgi:hypothetical protein